MKNCNGRITKRLTGVTQQSTTSLQCKATVTIPCELERFTNIFAHPSIHLDKDTKCSMSLVLRRAMVLLEEHQLKLSSNLDIDEEIQAFKNLAKSGRTTEMSHRFQNHEVT